MTIDWNDAYDNVSYIKGSDKLPDYWATSAKKYREEALARGKCELDLTYGDHERQSYDLFEPESKSKGTVIFIHGGYWMKFDKSYWSHLAKGANDRGWTVAVVSYPLAPEARISEITKSVNKAIETIAARTSGKLRLIGHSAGGHLVTRNMCVGMLSDHITARIDRVIPVSGLYDLSALRHANLNETLQITEQEVQVESPCFLEPTEAPIQFWVGADERPEFVRQTRLIAEAWSAKRSGISNIFEAEKEHFNVIDSLINSDSQLCKALLS